MPYNVPAAWPEDWQLPRGVIDAEERAREARIIEERQANNARIVASLRLVPATCQHDDINVFQAMGSAQDDHEVAFGECRACKQWVVSTLFFGGGHRETRDMTDKELTQFRALEDRRQREEWWDEESAS